MASSFSHIYALLLLCILCQPVDVTSRELFGSETLSIGFRNSTSLNRTFFRLFSPDEIFQIITVFEEEESPVHFQLLYDPMYEETVHSFTRSISKEMLGLTLFANDGEVTTLRRILVSSTERKTTVLMVLCSALDITSIFQKIRIYRLSSHFVNWVLLLEGVEVEDEVVLQLEGTVHEGTRVTLLTRESSGGFRILKARVDSTGIVRFYYQGNLDHDDNSSERKRQLSSLMTTNDESVYLDMGGRELVVGANDIWPFFRIDFTADGTPIPRDGIDVTILKALSANLNFTYRVLIPPDKLWGLPQPDGTVTGFIGLVARREAHFAISVIALTSQRHGVVEFSFPYFEGPLGIFSRAPKQKNRALAAFSPFTFEVWGSLILSVLVMGPILFVVSRMSQLYLWKRNEPTLQQFSFNVFRNIIVQGNLIETSRWPQRCLFLFWYLFCLIISALYSGMLTAVLAIPAYEIPIDSLDDLPRAVADGFVLGVVKETTNEYIFRDAKQGIYKRTWDLFNHEDMSQSYVNSPGMGIDQVLKRKFVFLGPKTLTEILALKVGRHKFHFAKWGFYYQNVGIACTLGAPYKDTFGRLILRMKQGGFIPKWLNDEIRKIPQTSSGQEESRFSAFTLAHLQAAFIVIVVGYIMCAVTLLLERLTFARLQLNKGHQKMNYK